MAASYMSPRYNNDLDYDDDCVSSDYDDDRDIEANLSDEGKRVNQMIKKKA